MVCCNTPAVNFPSIEGDTYSITGNGTANLLWTNAPTLANQAENVTATILSSQSNQVSVYRWLDWGGQTQFSLLAGQTTANSTTNGLTAIRNLMCTVSANASLAVEGFTTLSILLNGYYLYQQNLWLPAVAGVGIQPIILPIAIPDSVEFTTNGGAGLFEATLSTALATGTIDVNGFFI